MEKLLTELNFVIYYFTFQLKVFFPYWLFGIIAGVTVSVFGAAKIGELASKLNTKKFSSRGLVFAAILGAVSPLCMYGTIPLLPVLRRKGVNEYLIAGFMVSSILLNPNLFVFSFALGAPVAVLRLFLSLTAGISAGIIVHRFFRGRSFCSFDNFRQQPKSTVQTGALKSFCHHLYRTALITGPYFLVGLLLTAFSERYLAKELVQITVGSQNGFGVILAASLGVPMYVCGGGTIPVLKGWLDNGMSLGAALAFMMTGPATKLTNLSAVKMILGVKNFYLFIGFNLGFATAAGIIIDVVWRFLK